MTTDQTSINGTTAALNVVNTVTTPGAVDLRDNVFANSQTLGTRYAVYVGTPSTVFSVIDSNDYWGGTGTLGYLGSAIATLGGWQLATGGDGNSIAVDPLFNSTTDLRPLPGSPLIAAGAPVGVVTDILGAPRSLKPPEGIKEAIQGDRGLAEAFGRMAEHLADNNVDISQDKVTLGLPLKMDPKTERFIGNARADAQLTRPYRPGFVVPDSA